jgi:hypothetical protein
VGTRERKKRERKRRERKGKDMCCAVRCEVRSEMK